jgi:AGZA family xanthine/uracil permease-like MFS transporter
MLRKRHPDLEQASILTQSGGTCVCTDSVDPTCAADPQYNTCLIGKVFGLLRKRHMLISIGVQRDLITATAAIAGIGSIAFGFLTNLPVALA